MVTLSTRRRAIGVVRAHVPVAVRRRVWKARVALKTLTARTLSVWGRYRCTVCDARVYAFEPLPRFILDNLQTYGWLYTEADAETCNIRHYSCPFCQACDRDRLYALYLRDYLKTLESNGRVAIVDFAPSAPLSRLIRRLIAESGRDISYRTADLYAAGVDDAIDLTDLRIYQDNQFDVFICSHVLEHVADDRKALRELFRVLKGGGRGILMVPIILGISEIDEDPTADEGERWRRFGQNDHVRLYSKPGFIDRVRSAGFLVHEYDRRFFGEDLFARNGLTRQSVLYVVEKRGQETAQQGAHRRVIE